MTGTQTVTGSSCRISDDTEGVGRGIARQEADARALAERLGLEVVAVWVDNSISAFSGKVRPGYVAACEAIESGAIGTLIADHPDRLHRSPRELEDFVGLVERTGCRVLTVTAGDLDFTTPEGRLMARITGAVARKESEDKQRRVLRKQRELRERGRPTNRLGYPYDRGGALNPERAAVVREMAQRLLDGESLGALCAELARRQVPTRAGGQWRPTTLRVMLTSPSVAGLQAHRGEIVGTGDWEPALDRVTWERVRQVLSMRQSPSSPSRYLLSGLATCGECGHHLTGHMRGRDHFYACNGRTGGCGRVFIVRDRLDALVEPRVASVLADEALRLATPTVDAEQLAVDIADAEARLASYAAMLDSGELQPIEWRTLRSAAVARLEALRDREAQVAAPVPITVGESWATLPDARKRALIASMVSVTVRRSTAANWTFDPSRVVLRWLH